MGAATEMDGWRGRGAGERAGDCTGALDAPLCEIFMSFFLGCSAP